MHMQIGDDKFRKALKRAYDDAYRDYAHAERALAAQIAAGAEPPETDLNAADRALGNLIAARDRLWLL